MTTTISAKGQVVIPQEVRVRMGLHAGDDLVVLSSGNEITLRPIRRPKKNLVEALRGLQGLELPPRSKERVRPIDL